MSGEETKDREIEVVIGGTNCGMMSFPDQINLTGLVAKALAETKNTARPPEDWEAKDQTGAVLDLGKHLSDYPTLVRVFITLKAGIGGQPWENHRL